MRKIVTAPTIIEDAYAAQGITAIAGVDEAGRGALAGPVVACAVVLPTGCVIEGVNDSKKVSAKRREELAKRIEDTALSFSFGIMNVDVIEEINILQASLMAMGSAVGGLRTMPGIALVDGNQVPQNLLCKAFCIKQGDSASHLIAAASILAKVERDKIMCELHNKHPEYGFDKHKGYGTIAHKAAIERFGLCVHHRMSFCKAFDRHK